MATIVGKNCATLLPITLTAALTGCGLTQSVKDGAVSVTYAIFYKQIKTLHLDIRAREGEPQCARGVIGNRSANLPTQRAQSV